MVMLFGKEFTSRIRVYAIGGFTDNVVIILIDTFSEKKTFSFLWLCYLRKH